MLDTLLQPSAVTRLLYLLQAAQPFLTPSWKRLAEHCIRLLSLSDLFFNPHRTDFSRLLRDIRGCTPSDDMNALFRAIRPFCTEEELQMLQMYEQFRQMQRAMEMWQMFSDLMPDVPPSGDVPASQSPFDHPAGHFQSVPEPEDSSDSANPLLAFLSPEQLSLYNSILSEDVEPPDTISHET